MNLLTIYREGLMSILQYLFCISRGEYKEGPGDLWDTKGEILANGLPSLVNISNLHFTCNKALQGSRRREFETHITSLSSCHPCNFNVTTHKIATEEDEGARILRSCRITFMTSKIV